MRLSISGYFKTQVSQRMVDEQWVEHGLTIARVTDGHVVADTWLRSLRRGIALGLALSLHLGLLLTLLVPPSAMRSLFARSARRDHAIDVRLIDNPSAPHVSSNPPPTARALPKPSSRAPSRVTQRPATQRPAPPSAPVAQRVQPLRQTLSTAPSAVPDYIPGGGFAQRLQQTGRGRAASALPGSGRPIVAGVHMIDARTQGLAGVVGFIGGMFGADPPHCVDVDAWRRMTPGQLAERDLTPNDVQQIADDNGCLPQKPTIFNHIDYHPGGPTH